MKVLILTTSYPRNSADPSGIFIKRLAGSLIRKGVKVTVLAPGDSQAKSHEWEEGIEIVRFFYAPRRLMKIAYGEGGIPENLRRSPWLFSLLPLFLISLISYTIILAHNCDVIHANWLQLGFLALPAKVIHRKPLVVTIRGSDFKKGLTWLGYLVFNYVEAITTVNQQWYHQLRGLWGTKVFYTPDGVEIGDKVIDPRTRFNISRDKIVVLYVGALRWIKGADFLFQIAKSTGKINPSIQFLIIGPGNPKEFGLDKLPNVICAGSLPPQEVLAIFPGCDIFIFPTRHEGRGIVFLEAMASGLPCVASNLPVIAEVLTSEAGILIEVGRIKEFVEAIDKLAKDSSRRKTMGEKARLRINELALDWDTCAYHFWQIFNKLTSQ